MDADAPIVERTRQSLVGRVADGLTLFGLVLAPIYGKRIGSSLTGGIAYADIVLGFAALARGVHLLMARVRLKTLQRHSFLGGTLGLFAVVGLLSGFLNGTNPLAWGYMRIVIATLGSLILVATFGDQEEGARLKLLQAFGLGCIILALSSFVGVKGQGRSLGWSIHPNALGHSCMMGAATAMWLWDNARKRSHRWFWGGAVLLNFAGIINSGSRGGFLGIGVGAILYMALRGNRRITVAAIAGTWLMVLVLLVGIVHLPAGNPVARFLEQGSSTSYAGISDEQRTDLLKGDMARIDAHPFFGNGFGDITFVHVAYLQGWVAAGFLAGLISMVLGLSMLLLPFVTRRRDLALACGAAAIAVAWTFSNILTARDQWLFLAIAFSSASSISSLGRDRKEA